MSAAAKKKTAGSDLSSTRGSEERHASLPATGRGQKRGRDNDIEKASDPLSLDQRRSSSRKRRKTSKWESPSPPTAIKTTGKAKKDPSPINSKTRGKKQPIILDSEIDTSLSSHPFLERTAESRAMSPSTSSHQESSFIQGSSPYNSKAMPSKPSVAPQKATVKHDPDDSPSGSFHTSPQDLDPKDTTKKKQAPETCQDSRRARAEARNARGGDKFRSRGTLLALHKDLPRSTKITVAGIPLDNTPADLVSHVKKKRQRVKNIDSKIKFTDKPQLQEETFNLRPAIHINVPDHIKSILVDDWENVTKNLSLVPLPSKPSANEILTSYFDEEKNKRHLGSPEADLLEEVVAGLKEYFEKCVGRILLYRFERQQYLEVYNAVQAGTGEYEGKGMGDIYGAEHLSRLFGKSLPSRMAISISSLMSSITSTQPPSRTADKFPLVSLPELIAQTNMDQQSVNRLREELHKLTQWLGKNSTRFFKAPYEAASQDYIEKVRGV